MPKRRKPAVMGVKEPNVIRCQGHLQWIRGCECSAPDIVNCEGRIEAAHVRSSGEGGVGMKPGDNWVIPLCSYHHAWQHRIGERSFEKARSIDMRAIAEQLWKSSPHGIKWRRENG